MARWAQPPIRSADAERIYGELTQTPPVVMSRAEARRVYCGLLNRTDHLTNEQIELLDLVEQLGWTDR